MSNSDQGIQTLKLSKLGPQVALGRVALRRLALGRVALGRVTIQGLDVGAVCTLYVQYSIAATNVKSQKRRNGASITVLVQYMLLGQK